MWVQRKAMADKARNCKIKQSHDIDAQNPQSLIAHPEAHHSSGSWNNLEPYYQIRKYLDHAITSTNISLMPNSDCSDQHSAKNKQKSSLEKCIFLR